MRGVFPRYRAGAIARVRRASALTSVTRPRWWRPARPRWPCDFAIRAFGKDRLDAPIRQFRLARQRLRFGPHLGGKAAVAVECRCARSQSCFSIEARWQSASAAAALSWPQKLGEVDVEAAVSLGQCRLSRRVAIDLALGTGMTFARGVGLALAAPKRPRAEVSAPRSGPSARPRRPPGLTPGGRIDAGLLEFVFEIDQRARSGQTPRCAGGGVGGGDEPIQRQTVAFRRLPTAGRSSAGRRAPPARSRVTTPICARRRASFDRRIDMRRQRLDASGSTGSPSITPALVQRIGADGSTGASRSSPSAAPSAFS